MKTSTSAPKQDVANRATSISRIDISRRSLLRGVFMGLGAASIPSWVLKSTIAHAQTPGGAELIIPLGPLGAQDFGPLEQKVVADNLTTVNHLLFAPAGFDVRVVMRSNVNPLTLDQTGTLGHINPDGGAVYPQPDGGWIYVSNSETNVMANGSVSALRFDASGTLINYYRICTGTRQNCAGGKTPWDTWITCEEVTGGFAYECDPLGIVPQRQLTALGARNGREAVSIDPIHHVCYQTLDSGSGKLVRFLSDPTDLEVLPNGVTRMNMVIGVSERLLIPAFGALPGYSNTVVPNDAAGNAALRQARPIQWVADTGTNGTNFSGGEGIWYYEIPEALRTVPTAGTVPTRGVIFFASKNDNRIWAIDIDNNLIELIYDTLNGQAFTNLSGAPTNFNQVDNVHISPMGDALVAEDGTAMRLAIMSNGQPPKLLMQITAGNSEIAGPAFTPDGSRLYFSSQRGPGGPLGTSLNGVIYEMTIPPRFRALQKAAAFTFGQSQSVPLGVTVTSDPVTVGGFLGPLTVSVSQANDSQFSVNGGPWTNAPAPIEAGQTLTARHTSATTSGALVTTTVTVGLPSGASQTVGTFSSVTAQQQAVPALTPLTTAAVGAALLGGGAAVLSRSARTS